MSFSTAQSNALQVMQIPLVSLSSIDPSDVVYSNDDYTSVAGTPYIQTYMLFTEPFQASLGTSGFQRYEGIFQIDVHVPIGNSRILLDPILAEIRDDYKRGTTLTNANIRVECKRAWESTPYNGEGWYVTPINIRWYAYVSD